MDNFINEEAYTMGELLSVLMNGKLIQSASKQEILERHSCIKGKKSGSLYGNPILFYFQIITTPEFYFFD